MDSDSIAWEEVSGEYGARIEPFTSLFCEPLLEEASDALGRPLAEVALLDVGCGTGALALAAAARGAHVTATDVAAGMVERTRRRAEAAGLSVRTLVADGCCLPLEHAGVFQLALSNFGAIFFRPPHAGIDEMLRCLRPGGIIGLTAWGGPKETEAFQIIPCVARSLFGDDFIGADVPEKGRMSGSPEALSAMLSSVGLEPHITGPVTRHLRCGNAIAFWHRFALASPGTRRMLARLSANQREALQAAVVSILEQRFGGGEIMLPASAYLAIGRARPILGPVHVGTAGFAGISGHWAGKGVFMPGTKNARGDAALDFYQEKFDAVEINGTAYAMPSASTISSWRAHSARNFCICPKAVSAFTHANDPSSAAALDALRTFLERVLALGPHLGPVLLQFSRSVKADRSLLDGIAATVHQVEKSTTVLGVQRSQSLETTASQDHEGNGNSQTLVVSEGSRLREGVSVQGSECMPHRGNVHPRLQLAIEFRHASWLTQGFALADYFQTRGWALVVHPNSLGRATTQHEARSGDPAHYAIEDIDRRWVHTAPFAYVRLHGNNDEHQYDYSEDELRRIAAILHGWRMRGIEIFAFILNDSASAAMPRNALTLRTLVHKVAREQVPRPPKAPKATIASMFTRKASGDTTVSSNIDPKRNRLA